MVNTLFFYRNNNTRLYYSMQTLFQPPIMPAVAMLHTPIQKYHKNDPTWNLTTLQLKSYMKNTFHNIQKWSMTSFPFPDNFLANLKKIRFKLFRNQIQDSFKSEKLPENEKKSSPNVANEDIIKSIGTVSCQAPINVTTHRHDKFQSRTALSNKRAKITT